MEKKKEDLATSDEFFAEMEKEWRTLLYIPKGKELLEIFPGETLVVLEKIRELQEEKERIALVMREKIQTIDGYSVDEFSKWFCKRIILMFEGREFDEITRHINRLKILIPQTKYKSENRQEFEALLEKARAFPIVDIAENAGMQLRTTGKRFMTLCPFHDEKSPSLIIYPDSNRYYCFGCSAAGDQINLQMKLYNTDFVSAVKLLN